MVHLNQDARCGQRVSAATGKLPHHQQNGLPMTDHHVIPYNRLRNVWNALLAANESAAIGTYIDVFAPDQDFARACKRFVTGTGSQEHTITTASGGLGRHQNSDMSAEVIASELFWAPWNLVEGPSRRTDDPGDGSDTFSFSGIGNEYWRNRFTDRQRVLENLSRCMKRYLDLAERHDQSEAAAVGSLHDALNEARQINTQGRIDFDNSRPIWQTRSVANAPADYRNANRARRNSTEQLDPDPRPRAGTVEWTGLS